MQEEIQWIVHLAVTSNSLDQGKDLLIPLIGYQIIT